MKCAISFLLLLLLLGCSDRLPADPSVDAAPVDLGGDLATAPDLLARPDIFPSHPAICHRPVTTLLNPGTKEFPVKRCSSGKWSVAFPAATRFAEYKLSKPVTHEGAAALDRDGINEGVAGFVVSRAGKAASAPGELEAALFSMPQDLKLVRRTSGVRQKAMGLFPAMLEVDIAAHTLSSTDAASLRDRLVAALLGRKVTELGALPKAFTEKETDFTVRLGVIRTFKPKTSAGKSVTDARGFLVDSGDKGEWQTFIIGGVALSTHAVDPKRQTAIILSDLANGTALWDDQSRLRNGCDDKMITALPTADLIWVVGEFPEMKTDLAKMMYSAQQMYSRLLSSGVDFRVGVTGANDPAGAHKGSVGKFCSKITKNPADPGGTDRFLLPNEQSIFSACMYNPPGLAQTKGYPLQNARAAVKGHLPRAFIDAAKVRKSASLHVIVVTDQASAAVKSALPCSSVPCPGCPLSAAQQTKVDQAVAPDLKLLSGITDPEAAATLHLVGPTCQSSCVKGIRPLGLTSLAQALGGQIIDMCQSEFSPAMAALSGQIAAAASTVRLSHMPVSSTILVQLDGIEIKRSLTNGFSYRDGALVLTNVKYKKGSQVDISYYWWGM